MSDNVLAGWSVLTEWPRLRLGHSVRTDRQLVHYPETRPVSSRSVHDGIFPDVYFYTQSLGRPHERRPMASRREQVSALFFVAWTQRPLTDSFPWATEGASPLKETLTFTKRIFWQRSLPAGLNCTEKFRRFYLAFLIFANLSFWSENHTQHLIDRGHIFHWKESFRIGWSC